jgi:hypothetical protein
MTNDAARISSAGSTLSHTRRRQRCDVDAPREYSSDDITRRSATTTSLSASREFLTQPFKDDVLLDATRSAIERSRAALRQNSQTADGRVKQRIGQAAYPDSFTLIDLRPIRPLVFGARHKALDADLVRVIHGFDSLLVLSGSNPSQHL